jgi:hypothetical protein
LLGTNGKTGRTASSWANSRKSAKNWFDNSPLWGAKALKQFQGFFYVFYCGETKSDAIIKKQRSRNLIEQLCIKNFTPSGFLAQLVRVQD